MASKKPTLYQVAPAEFRKIKEELAKYLPDSFMVENAFNCYFAFGELKTSNFSVFKAEGEGLETFILIKNVCSQPKMQSFVAFWNPSTVSTSDIDHLISAIPNWNWENAHLIPTGSLDMDRITRSILQAKTPSSAPLIDVTSGCCCICAKLMTIQEEDIRLPRLSEGFELRPLAPTCASFILKYWDLGGSETIEGIEERLSKYRSFGVFKKCPETSESNRNMPLAWTLQYAVGTMGMTYTLPEYRRKGFAAATTLRLAKELLSLGIGAYVGVDNNNKDAYLFHEKIGFQEIGKTGLILRHPEGMSLDDLYRTSCVKTNSFV